MLLHVPMRMKTCFLLANFFWEKDFDPQLSSKTGFNNMCFFAKVELPTG